ncbi:MAG: tetratricopeptide repeat protein [Bacteroidales bacterium]|nr:tetratricopeptide repeat protein [Bacteroidales bacterium]
MRYFVCVFVTFSLAVTSLYAQSVNDGKALYQEGKYAEALPIFEKAIKSSPRNASYNHWYGTCLLETGQPEKAKEYLVFAAGRKITEAYHSLARTLYLLYEFEESATAYTQYKEALTKDKKTAQAEEVVPLIQRAERAARMLSRCENIQIIDSMILDKRTFLDAYSLSAESGSLEKNGDQVIYLNPLKDKRFYAEKGEDGGYRIFSEIKLQDKWSDKKELDLSDDSIPNNNYPFVLQDGMTVYFASTGNNSIGGYDLFITRYNINNDTYLSPNQMGMPFNSIANDYMMAIDEINNLGYFATDRFMPENKVVVYTFIPNEEIIPIHANSDEELISRAKITSIRDSWKLGSDYQAHLTQARKNIQEEQNKAARDFFFVINDNIIYYTLNDFENDAAKQSFLKFQQLNAAMRDLEIELDSQRKEYAGGNNTKKQSLRSSILSNESRMEKLVVQQEEAAMNARNLEIKYLRTSNK